MSRPSRTERSALARFSYRLDRFLGLSPGVQLLAVLGLGVVLGLSCGALIWAFDTVAPQPVADAAQSGGNQSPVAHSLGAGFWWAITRMLDGGTVYSDSGTGFFRQTFGVLVTLVGLFAVAVVTGWTTSRITERVSALRRGTAPVFERDHLLVLGWNAHAPVVLAELAASGIEETVVVLAEHDRESIEEALRQQLPAHHRLRVVVRRGDPASPAAVRRAAARRAKAILLLPDTPSGHCGDRASLRSLLALEGALGEIAQAARPTVVIEVATEAGRDMVDLCNTGGKVTVVDAHDVNARVVAQAVRHFGAFAALRKILAIGPHSIEVRPREAPEGVRFDEIYARFEDGILIGLVRDGKPLFSPAGDVTLRGDDALLVLDDASDARRSGLELHLPSAADAHAEPRALRILVVRFRFGMAAILGFLEAQGPVEVTLLAPADQIAEASTVLAKAPLTRTTITYLEGDPLDGHLLARLAAEQPDAALLLAPDVDGEHALEADADQILSLLLLRRGEVGSGPHAVVEVRSADTRRLPRRLRHKDDFILSREIVGTLLARELYQAYLDKEAPAETFTVLERVGSSLELGSVASYARGAASPTFGELAASARARGEVAIGFQEEGRAPRLAPAHDVKVPLAGTRLVVLTPSRA